MRHFFAEDVAGVRRGLDLVLEHDPRELYVGHGGPNVHATDVRRRLDSIAPQLTLVWIDSDGVTDASLRDTVCAESTRGRF